MILASSSHLFTCFCIKSEGGIGTAFAYKSGDRTHFLTAQHVLGGSVAGGYVFFKTPRDWERFELTGTTSHPDGYDAATFGVAGIQVAVDHQFSHPDDPKLALGQEVKFTGFPHGLENTAASPTGYSTPLVRTAFFSGVITEPANGRSMLILDGLNNPGYSGGPIWAPGTDSANPSLLGLISGYRIEERGKSLVYEQVPGDIERPINGMFVKPNSGMIHAIAYADLKELIATSNDANYPK